MEIKDENFDGGIKQPDFKGVIHFTGENKGNGGGNENAQHPIAQGFENASAFAFQRNPLFYNQPSSQQKK